MYLCECVIIAYHIRVRYTNVQVGLYAEEYVSESTRFGTGGAI